jgi:putative transposase
MGLRALSPCAAFILERRTHITRDMKEATQLIEAWRQEYYESRPNASLDDRTPSEFASQVAARRDLAAT